MNAADDVRGPSADWIATYPTMGLMGLWRELTQLGNDYSEPLTPQEEALYEKAFEAIRREFERRGLAERRAAA
jgi:hypothetical protein